MNKVLSVALLVLMLAGCSEYEYKTIVVGDAAVGRTIASYGEEGWKLEDKTEVEKPARIGLTGFLAATRSTKAYSLTFKRRKSPFRRDE